MPSVLFQTLATIAIFLSSLSEAAPLDGLTKRADKVIGLDFDYVVGDVQNTTELTKRGDGYDAELINKKSFYLTYLELGSDKQKVGVDIDTGSSDLWVPNSSLYGRPVAQYGTYDSLTSKTSRNTHQPFRIVYGDLSSTLGTYVTDDVTFGGVDLKDFQFAQTFQSSTNVGILGIGLESLEAPVIYGYGNQYTNLPFALKEAGYIDSVKYSLYLNSPSASTGSLLFGGKDLAKIDGELVTLPHSGEDARLDVTLNSITVSGKVIDVTAPVNLDSGTTLTYLSNSVYNAFVKALGGNGQKFAQLPIVDCQQTGNLTYNFDGISIDVPLADIVQPIGFNRCVAQFMGGGQNILGDTFLRYAYLVYDLETKEISMAKAKFTTKSDVVAI